MAERPSERILWLDTLAADDAPRVGAKAANLGELSRLRLPVPNGFVVLGEPGAELEAALAHLGPGPFAVRSSATAEDRADASFAGQYETILDVAAEGIPTAIDRCRASAANSRVLAYRERRGLEGDSRMAVLVQPMVDAVGAGVAFTANPVTGNRSEVVVSAAKGLGERLVSGVSTAEEWTIRGSQAVRTRSREPVLTNEQAISLAALARRAADHFGRPQDIEWALSAGGDVWLLQSRPMTALPAAVDWRVPGRDYWMRNLRLGEWLPEPMTPLFEDWLLKRLNEGFARGNGIDVGLGAAMKHTTVNGWYYSTAQPNLRVEAVLRGVVTRPATLFRFATSLLKQSTEPDISERRYFRRVVRRWREEAMPRYRSLVEARHLEVDRASREQLFEIVDEVGVAAGEQLWCLAVGGGSAWKVEVALARFFREHLATKVSVEVIDLLVGLPSSISHSAPYLVESADWYRPTFGERGWNEPSAAAARRGPLAARRTGAEDACRQALADHPALRKRFDVLLEIAQRYSQLREEQAFQWTLAWPVLRRCVQRLGIEAQQRGAIDASEDVFFLNRRELESVIGTGSQSDLRDQVATRRAEWESRRRLSVPLAIGNPPKLLQRMLGSLELLRSDARAGDGALHGEPASPGRASGHVRIVRDRDDFAAFREGEVLVAQSTAPAWTPLFARAAAVVTDGGSLAAHASLVAREYGIPAVVATGDATARLTDGQRVTVDGSGGFVEL
jgi:rifampicin phosphotransferase